MAIFSAPYSFSNAITEPPTADAIRFDAGHPYETVTKVWIPDRSSEGTDVSAVLLALTYGADLHLQDKDDAAKFARYTLTAAPTDRGTYVEIPVTWTSNGLELTGSGGGPQTAIVLTMLSEGALPTPPGATTFIRAPWAMPQGVSSMLLVPPIEEPLTLTEAKLRAGLDWPSGDPRDDLMTGFISAARMFVELRTGLALLTQTRAVTFDPWWCANEWVVPLPMQATPVQSLTDPDGNPVDPASYRFDRRTRALAFPSSVSAGTWTVVAGWPTRAALKQEAPLLVHAVGLLVAHYATVGRDLAITGTIIDTVPYGFDEAIAPFELVVLP